MAHSSTHERHYLVRDPVEHMCHVAEMSSREDRVEELSLALVLDSDGGQ